ncbi:serine protease 30-like [Ixodes scapularis]|uniref:serine protease 30-like n=1 Tax=Ixodes scapularis TaxID=6945 RepID=UPI001C38FB05|nr:serine protease 30-like [Ixodes scapularis]
MSSHAISFSLRYEACGVRGPAARGAAQIVGGKTAGQLEFPWQISLHLVWLPNLDLGHICGGSIINKQFVDTAAHCIMDGYNSPSNYIVVVGEENLDVIDPYEEWIPVVNDRREGPDLQLCKR